MLSRVAVPALLSTVVTTTILASCAPVVAPECAVSRDCDDGLACVDGACVDLDGPPARGEGEGEGVSISGEGEGEGTIVVGEGEGEGTIVVGEGEGEGTVVVGGEGEGEGEGAPLPAPIVGLVVDDATLLPGRATQLHVSATGASSCTLSPSIGAVHDGDVVAIAPRLTTTYALHCTNAQGLGADATTTVGLAPCAARCVFDTAAHTQDCGSGVQSFDPGPAALFTVTSGPDNSGALFDVEVCDPNDHAFTLADSENADGFGGNSATSCADAELDLFHANLTLYAAQTATHLLDATPVQASGCSSFSVLVEDRVVALDPPSGPRVVDDSAFRLSPTCGAGSGSEDLENDRAWHLGIGCVPNGLSSRCLGAQTGVTRVEVCVR